MRKGGLEPVIDNQTKVLILGSLPSDKSISSGQYYANPVNDFWRLMEKVLDERVVQASYQSRISTLLKRRIGLWDIFQSAYREGSMDEKIETGELNDFSILKAEAPNLRLIALNGKKAGEYEHHFTGLGYDALVLPSSSSANRKDSEQRDKSWSMIRYHL